MADPIPLSKVRVATPVSWDGPSTTTLTSKHGSLTFDPDEEIILAIPNDPKKEEMIIPRDAVVMMVPLHSMRALAAEPQEQKPDAALGSATPLPAIEAPEDPVPTEDDVVRYVKDAKTGEVKAISGKAQ